MMQIGAFDPAGTLGSLDVEHVFCAAHDPAWAIEALRGVTARGRTPLLTVEPRHGPPDARTLRRWREIVLFRPGLVYVRYMHEPNLAPEHAYPWGGQPDRFQDEWARWTAAMPTNARRVWSPNVSYPGSGDLIRYWPHPGSVDVIALDGYARNGETPAELFRPTLDEIAGFLRGERKPVWIAETAAPRGRAQARYAEALVAFAEQQGIGAVLWLNQDKSGQGLQERDWSLTPAAERALLGGRARPPKRRRR